VSLTLGKSSVAWTKHMTDFINMFLISSCLPGKNRKEKPEKANHRIGIPSVNYPPKQQDTF
jgi:hypothetical protein